MQSYPKVLLLCSLSQSTANGITIGHLFRDWPADRIALAEFNDPIEAIYVPNISRYYIIGAKEARFVKPFGYIKKMRASQTFELDAAPPSQESKPRSGSGKGGLKAKIGALQNKFLHRSGLSMVSRQFNISPEFERWVREFGPDLIYCTGGDICKLEFLLEMKRRFNVPCAIHIFDDYINSKHEGTLLPGYWKKRLNATFRKVVATCDLHLAIGDKMAAEYTEKYGKPFYGFHNPIDPTVWLSPVGGASVGGGQSAGLPVGAADKSSTDHRLPTTDHRELATGHRLPSTEFSFLYAGKINKDTIGPIRRFIDAVVRLNTKGQKLSFGIHSPYPFEEIERLLGPSAKDVYLGKIPYAELPGAYRKANGLLLPLDFTEATIRYIRLSMLTKASEYMISGTPIFCFAPKEIAVTEYLVEHDAAIHCGDPEQLESAILDFIKDSEGRKRVSQNAVERAQSHHMMGQVNQRLQCLIEVAVNGACENA